jgi:hypothetical protein
LLSASKKVTNFKYKKFKEELVKYFLIMCALLISTIAYSQDQENASSFRNSTTATDLSANVYETLKDEDAILNQYNILPGWKSGCNTANSFNLVEAFLAAHKRPKIHLANVEILTSFLKANPQLYSTRGMYLSETLELLDGLIPRLLPGQSFQVAAKLADDGIPLGKSEKFKSKITLTKTITFDEIRSSKDRWVILITLQRDANNRVKYEHSQLAIHSSKYFLNVIDPSVPKLNYKLEYMGQENFGAPLSFPRFKPSVKVEFDHSVVIGYVEVQFK